MSLTGINRWPECNARPAETVRHVLGHDNVIDGCHSTLDQYIGVAVIEAHVAFDKEVSYQATLSVRMDTVCVVVENDILS